MCEIVASEHELKKVVDEIKKRLPEGGVVLLQGDLGSGKTTLVKAFAKEFGSREVTSPTFSIQQIYDNGIYHYDLYNAGFEKFMELGLFEELFKRGYHFIEWADEHLKELLKQMGLLYIHINITPNGEKRIYRCID